MALTLLAANNAQTVLASGISASATSITVNTGTGALFPSPSSGTSFFKLTFIDAATGQLSEIVHVTARSGDTMTIERGQEGTSARAWSANDIAANMMTAGTLIYILNNFQPLDNTLTALAALATGANKLPYFTGTDTAAQTDLTQIGRDVIGQTTVANLLTYLGLKTAAQRDVGTGSDQIPDMSSFTSSLATTGWQKLPGGFVLQWGQAATNASSLVAVPFPIPFPKNVFQIVGSCIDINNANIAAINSTDRINLNLVAWVAALSGGSVTRTTTPVKWIAIGN